MIATGVITLDQLTKHWALTALGEGHRIDVVWTLRFNLAFNKGTAFSQGEWLGPVIPILAIGIAVILLRSVRRTPNPLLGAAAGLVIGGALGNVIDRLFRNERWFQGAVVDFIDLQWWPIFNLADVAVVVGGGLLVLRILRES